MTNKKVFLPKSEILADQFVVSHPNFNGKFSRIAIWDTGIDPTAGGLQVTPDGIPKVLDYVDASGSGDVNMEFTHQLTGQNETVKTLTGRYVKIPSHWKPHDGILRIGVKRASELFPQKLLRRLRADAKQSWSAYVKETSAQLDADIMNAEKRIRAGPLNGLTPPADVVENGNSYEPLKNSDTSSVASDNEAPLNQENADIFTSLNDSGSLIDEPLHSNLPLTKRSGEDSNTMEQKGTSNISEPQSSQNRLDKFSHAMRDSLGILDQQCPTFDIVYDCFVFHDGTDWLACVDTSPYVRNQTLENLPLLADFSVQRDHSSFGTDTQLYYTVKILDDGQVLQIVTNGGSHGTHVAAMTAAYFPPADTSSSLMGDQKRIAKPYIDRDGVAPGAQLVSIKISDSRLGSMETCLSLIRAIRWTMDYKCDVVNYSFGELGTRPNIGRICQHLIDMINLHGIVMVSSGGNNGPGLGTVGCPGGEVEDVIGVAPLVFPDMMRTLYEQPLDPIDSDCDVDNKTSEHTNTVESSTIDGQDERSSGQRVTAAPGTAYTWGSRGLASDGAVGLCVSAPGAANTSVAAWQLQPAALMNGSSMSSPLVAGGVALLISGIRQTLAALRPDQFGLDGCHSLLRIPPILIRRALMNTAKPVKHLTLLDQGAGLMQTDQAFEHLLNLTRLILDEQTDSTCKEIEQPNKNQCALSPSLTPSNFFSRFDWRIRCTVQGPGCPLKSRGLWLRCGWPLCADEPPLNGLDAVLSPLRYKLNIDVHFDETVSMQCRRSFELQLTTTLRSTGKLSKEYPLVRIAQSISVTSAGRTINFMLDPNALLDLFSTDSSIPDSAEFQSDVALSVEPNSKIDNDNGYCYSGPVESSTPFIGLLNLTDSLRPELGVLAQLPIVIHSPIRVRHSHTSAQSPRLTIADTFDATHKVRRWFIRIPVGSTAGIFRLARTDCNDIHCEFSVSICFPYQRCGQTVSGQEVNWLPGILNRSARLDANAVDECARVISDPDTVKQFTFSVPFGADLMEVAVAQYWGAEAEAHVVGELCFCGLEVSPQNITMQASDRYTHVMLRSNFTMEELAPVVSLTHWALPLRPSRCTISYMGNGQSQVLSTKRGCYALQLVYEFSCPFNSSDIVFELPLLQELLYESDYLFRMYQIYDSFGRLIGVGEYEKRKFNKRPRSTFKIKAGHYKVLVQVCHEQGRNLLSSSNKKDSRSDSSSPDKSHPNVQSLSPLDRLMKQPALVYFSLSGPARNVVTFEFVGHMSSLGLAGSKPMNALNSSESTRRNKVHIDVASYKGPASLRCRCLPSQLNIRDSANVYIGLASECYPSYAVPGSYYCGSASFYRSNGLQNTVSYPFRLIIDSYLSPPPTISPVNPNTLLVGSFGISTEDFTWLQCAGSWLLTDDTEWITSLLNCSKPGGDVPDKSNADDACLPENRSSVELHEDAALISNGELAEVTVPETSNSDQKAIESTHQNTEPISLETEDKREPIIAAIVTGEDSTEVQQISSSKELLDRAPQLTGPKQQTVDDVVQPLDKVKTQECSKLTPISTSALFEIHKQLISIDVLPPDTVIDYHRAPLKYYECHHQIWQSAAEILLKQVSTHAGTEEKPFKFPSFMDCWVNPGTISENVVQRDRFFEALLHLSSLPLRPLPKQCENKETDKAVAHTSSVLSKSELEITVTSVGCNISEHSTKPGLRNRRNPEVIDFCEFKVTLIDTLARYGRLLCEQLLLSRLLKAYEDGGDADPLYNGWTVNRYLLNKGIPSYNTIDSMPYQVLNSIHLRLVRLTTQKVKDGECIGNDVSIGTHALPSWLLLATLGQRTVQKFGSVGGRMMTFFLLNFLTQSKYADALQLLVRLSYQRAKPAIGSFSDKEIKPPILKRFVCDRIRTVFASTQVSEDVAKLFHPWLVWLLKHVGWTEISNYLNQQRPMLHPERDYCALTEIHS